MQDLFVGMQWSDIKFDIDLPNVDTFTPFADAKQKEVEGFILVSEYSGTELSFPVIF